MAENNLAIGDYIAVLNNLDDYDTVPEPEWPSLMTPMPSSQTSEPNSSPTNRQNVVPTNQVRALQENCRNLAFKICQTSVPKPSDPQVQATKMVVARQIDLSVQTTIKFVPDISHISSYSSPCGLAGCTPSYSSFRESPLQSSSSCSVAERSVSEPGPFLTPDSGLGTPVDDNLNDTQISADNANTHENLVTESFTPKPIKRRRRTAMLNMLASRCRRFDSGPSSLKSAQQDSLGFQNSGSFLSRNCSSVTNMQQDDSGIGNSFISEKGDLSDFEDNVYNESSVESPLNQDPNKSTATSKRKRRAKIIRPSEEEFQEKIAARLVGRLVIKQSIPKYRITYNELLRRVGPPELFNVSALITLFRIKKDAESSTRILSILKDAGFELKKGRRMNRSITRFSSFAEEEALETGRDLEKIAKTYTPVQSAAKLFFKKQKDYQPINVLLSRMQRLPTFYLAAKNIIESDRTPLAFHRTPANAVPLNPELQERLGYLTWVSHGFSKTAYAGLIDSLRCTAESNLSYASQNSQVSSDTVQGPSMNAFANRTCDSNTCLPVQASTILTSHCQPLGDNNNDNDYNNDAVSDACCQAYQNHFSYKDTYNFGANYNPDDGCNTVLFGSNNFSMMSPGRWGCYSGRQDDQELEGNECATKTVQRPSFVYYQ